jgi:hypothetical protein
MTEEDMIRMAREAGWQYADGESGYTPLWKFAELVAAAEREKCAALCDKISDDDGFEGGYADYCAHAIRARGQG